MFHKGGHKLSQTGFVSLFCGASIAGVVLEKIKKRKKNPNPIIVCEEKKKTLVFVGKKPADTISHLSRLSCKLTTNTDFFFLSTCTAALLQSGM